MEFQSSMIVVVFAISLLFYVLKLRPKNKPGPARRSPPQAAGSKPFLGHLHLLSGTSHADLPHFKLATLADKYGPIFTIRLGVNRALVVSSWVLMKELCTTHDVAISNRPRLRAFKHLSYDCTMFASAPYGRYFREVRKLIAMKLLSNRRIEIMSHPTMSEIGDWVSGLYSKWNTAEQGRDSSGRVLVDMKQWFGDMNLNIIFRMMVGKSFFDGGANAEEGKRRRRVMRDWFHYVGLFVPGDALPYLAWLDIGGLEKKMKKTASEMDEIMHEWLEDHKAEAGKKKEYEDFMDVLLQELARGTLQAGDYDLDMVIKGTCILLIAGATDTTAVMLEWGLSLLLNHRHIMKRLQEELDSVIGKGRRANESDISKLTYLQAVVKETLRLYPAAPLGGIREFSKDVNVGGYDVPKGTWLITNLRKLQRDPEVWGEDADEFKPERFLGGAHKDFNIVGQDFEMIPFGAGRRICPGLSFGMQMLHSVFANVLHAFDFETDEPIVMTESPGMTNSKATPLDVLLSPRLSPHLY